MLNFSQPHEIFRLTITSAIKLLKEDHLHVPTTWQTIIDDVIQQLDLNKDKLYLYKEDLENLTALLLLRTTTRLGYIKQPEFYKPARKILQRVRDLGLSRALVDGINEFLLTPETWFKANHEQDRELLTYQLQAFETILQKEKSKFCQNFQVEVPSMLPVPSNLNNNPPLPLPAIGDARSEISQAPEKEEINLDLIKAEKGYSLCILDIQGDFLLVDKAAENIFEKNQEELLQMNIFELMIPFSVCYLQKKFQSLHSDGQKRTFSYTIYSKNALKRLKTTLDSLEKKDQTEKRRKKTNKPIDLDESVNFDCENSVYYKYLQTLTSDATLINLKMQNIQEFHSLIGAAKVKIREDHRAFKSNQSENSNDSPVILLITRKAYHIQKFKYSFMQEHDETISNMEIKSKRTLSKMQQKLFQKNISFGNRHNINN